MMDQLMRTHATLFEGGISSDWAKTLRHVPGAELEAVAARSLSSATKFAEAHGVRTVLETYTELVQSDSVDIVCEWAEECGPMRMMPRCVWS